MVRAPRDEAAADSKTDAARPGDKPDWDGSSLAIRCHYGEALGIDSRKKAQKFNLSAMLPKRL